MTAPQRLTDRKREAIVAAAIAEFRENGFEVTSMDKIAATAGVSKRTVYNHFPSKEELFAEILHQLWASSVAQLDVSYASDRPLREQLRGLLNSMFQKIRKVLPKPPCCTGASLLKCPRSCLGAAGEESTRDEIVAIYR